MKTLPRLCALSIDLDEIPNYYAIHGLTAPPAAASAVYDRAVERFAHLAQQEQVPLTFFAVGADLERSENAVSMRQMVAQGHEISNHSWHHWYDLTRRSAEVIEQEICGGADVIERAVGVRPKGFRAPGYTINEHVVRALHQAGAVYDSSVFPSVPYYAAKALAMGAIALRGRKSRSVLDHPRVLAAPTRPFRMANSYHRRGQGLVELPVQVTRGLRLPYIGTTLTLLGARRARWFTRLVHGEPLINLELHGIDLLDSTDGLQALLAHQPDVRVPVGSKLETLRAVIGSLRERGYSFIRLDEAPERLAALLDAS